MSNIFSNIGETLIVRVIPLVSGKMYFSSFQEDIVGETPDRYLSREYRTSTDDIFWSDWKELNNFNVSQEILIAENLILIEIRYIRNGSDSSGVIQFNNIQFLGTIEDRKFIAPTINSSIFESTIGSECLTKIENNLFKKLYYRGILPRYIIRAENRDKEEDKDFIDLFFSISRFFGMLLCFFKRFENIFTDFDLLREQVRQQGLYFDESKITLNDLQFLSANSLSEIRKRGTEMIFKRKGDVLKNGNTVPIDGELLRLFRISDIDEVIYDNISLNKFGWCLRNSSPLYRGTCSSVYLNKTLETSSDFTDLQKYEINNTGNSSYNIFNTENKNALRLIGSGISTVGLGRVNGQKSDKMTIVDVKIDYEITFAFKISNLNSDASLNFGVEGFDKFGEKLNDAFILPNGNSNSETFFTRNLNLFRNDCWYYCRGIIHSYSTTNVSESKINLGFGNNLYFYNPFLKFILPKIQLVTTNSINTIDIWDYKIRPLVRGTNIIPLKNGVENSFSLGFIQSSRFFHLYAHNNNTSIAENEITSIVERYLLPIDNCNIFTITQ